MAVADPAVVLGLIFQWRALLVLFAAFVALMWMVSHPRERFYWAIPVGICVIITTFLPLDEVQHLFVLGFCLALLLSLHGRYKLLVFFRRHRLPSDTQ